jgi:hypothetical protein
MKGESDGRVSLNKVLYCIVFVLLAVIVIVLGLNYYRSSKEPPVPEMIEESSMPELLANDGTLMRKYLSKKETVELWNALIMAVNFTTTLIEKFGNYAALLEQGGGMLSPNVTQLLEYFNLYLREEADVKFYRGLSKCFIINLFSIPDPTRASEDRPNLKRKPRARVTPETSEESEWTQV